MRTKKKNKYSVNLGFLVNNLELEGMHVTEEEKLIFSKILEGKIDTREYLKAVLADR